MNLLNKQQILSARDVLTEYEEVPEWEGTVRIKAMTLAEHMYFEKLRKDNEDITAEQISYVLSTCLIDEAGESLFTPEEAILLMDKSVSVVSRLFMKCAELSKVKTEEKEKN